VTTPPLELGEQLKEAVVTGVEMRGERGQLLLERVDGGIRCAGRVRSRLKVEHNRIYCTHVQSSIRIC
jgi:hypothetical protein